MKKAKVSELKARLSYYLGVARRGEEVLVFDRDTPVARIVQVDHLREDDTAAVIALLATGLAERSAGGKRLGKDHFEDLPTANKSAVQALLAEREDGR